MTPSHPSLPPLAGRQRLGILPTRAFWSRSDVQDVAAGLLSVLMLPLVPVYMLVFWAGWGLPAWAWFGVLLAGGILAEGILERYLRSRLDRRARALEDPEKKFEKTEVLDATPRRGGRSPW